MATKGIDVSKYQGTIDYAKVKTAGIKFVIINAGYGKYINQKDPKFEENYKNAKAQGLNVGAYWYSYATTEAEAEEEAKVFLEAIKGKSFEYPIALDIEDQTIANLSNDTINKIIEKFCSHCEKAGYYVSIYSYASFLNNRVWESEKKKYDVWVANFDVSKPDYTGSYGMWQYTSTGKISGISTNVDCDYAYKDYPSIIKEAGLNGCKKTTSSSTAKVLDSSGYKKDDKGVGVYALKKLLLIAYAKKLLTVKVDDNNKYDDTTVKAVNALLKKWGYTQNGIAGEKFVKLLGGKLV